MMRRVGYIPVGPRIDVYKRQIIDRVEAKYMLNAMEVPTLNLTDLGIGEEYYEAVEKVV